MTAARHLLVSPSATGFYHCVTRCVRRAWLCGDDPVTGRSFAHRRQWIEDRIGELGAVFAVSIYAYAVMSNHVHVVLRVDPSASQAWTDDDVADRWCRLFPPRSTDARVIALRRTHLLANPERLALYRQRLGDLSWFMRCLNEPIARRANAEDRCTGRFWEGRYKCQALLDDTAVLAAMTYVDLNPIRAGIADQLEACDHTSVKRRLATLESTDRREAEALTAVAGCDVPLGLTARHYIDLVDFTGRLLRPGKRGVIAANAPRALTRLDLEPDRWAIHVRAVGSGYWRAVGTTASLLDKAQAMGQRWFKGIGIARDVARAVA